MGTPHEDEGARREDEGARRADESVRREAESARREDENPRRRATLLLASVTFILTGGLNLLLGKWLSAAFFFAGGFFFYKGKEIDRWPKAVRALVIIALAALGVAMVVNFIVEIKGRG